MPAKIVLEVVEGKDIGKTYVVWSKYSAHV